MVYLEIGDFMISVRDFMNFWASVKSFLDEDFFFFLGSPVFSSFTDFMLLISDDYDSRSLTSSI